MILALRLDQGTKMSSFPCGKYIPSKRMKKLSCSICTVRRTGRGEYLKKGSKVYIEGALRTRQWDKEGQKHYSTEIIANEMQMLDGRNDGGMGGGFNQNNQPPNAGGGSSEFGSGGGQGNGSQGGSQDFSAPPPEAFDDDIPF